MFNCFIDPEHKIEGFYIKPDIKLKLNYTITNFQLVLKKESYRIKIYIEEYDLLKKKKNNNKNNISKTRIKINIDSDNIISYFIII